MLLKKRHSSLDFTIVKDSDTKLML